MKKFTKLSVREIRKLLKGWENLIDGPFESMPIFKEYLNNFLLTIERGRGRKFSKRELPRIVKSYAYGWDDGRESL